MVVTLIGAAYFVLTTQEYTPDAFDDVACTEEAKECDDGSFVVRGGPDCEFTECPAWSVDVPTNPSEDIVEGFQWVAICVLHEVQPVHHHPGDPEEDDVETGDQD